MNPIDRMKEMAAAENRAARRRYETAEADEADKTASRHKLDKCKLLELAKAGQTPVEIARFFGSTEEAVRYHIRKAKRAGILEGDVPDLGWEKRRAEKGSTDDPKKTARHSRRPTD